MSNQVFYSLYRLYAEMHGPGDSAEIAALFTWCVLVLSNVATVLVLLLVAIGNPVSVRGYIPHVAGAVGLIVAVSQYMRYLTGDRLEDLLRSFQGETTRLARRRRWISVVYSISTMLMLFASLWILSDSA